MSVQAHDRAGAELDAAIDKTLSSARPDASEIREHVEVLRQLAAHLEVTAKKLDDLAEIREFAERVGLRK